MINTKDSDEEKRKKSSEELKLEGNKAFQDGAYQLAEEYFTSAILQWDRNHVLFNNRALARISQNKVKYNSAGIFFLGKGSIGSFSWAFFAEDLTAYIEAIDSGTLQEPGTQHGTETKNSLLFLFFSFPKQLRMVWWQSSSSRIIWRRQSFWLGPQPPLGKALLLLVFEYLFKEFYRVHS